MATLFNRIKLKNKLLAFILPPILILIIFMIVVVFYKVNDMLFDLANSNAITSARYSANEYKSLIEKPLYQARALAKSFETYQKIDRKSRREIFMHSLKSVIESDTNYFGVWTIWEPNALDSLDSENIGKLGMAPDGRYVPYYNRSGGLHLEYCVDYEKKDAQGEYYWRPLNTQKDAIINPVVYKIDNKDMMVVSVCTPIIINGKSVGVVGFDFSIENMKSILTSVVKLEDSYGILIANDMQIAAHPNPSYVSKSINNISYNLDSNQVTKYIKDGKEFSVFSKKKPSDSLFELLFSPMKITDTETPWSLAISIPIELILARSRNLALILTIIGLFFISLVVIIIYYVSTKITKPLFLLHSAVENFDIAELEKSLNLGNKDEISELSKAFLKMTKDLNKSFADLNESAERFALAQKTANFAAWELKQNEIVWFADIDSLFHIHSENEIKHIEDFISRIHPSHTEKFINAYKALNATNSIYKEEIRFKIADGTYKYLSVVIAFLQDGNTYRYIGFALDITDRKAREEERNMLAKAIAQTFEGVVISNIEGEIIYVNQAFQELSGYSQDELIKNNERYYFDFLQALSTKSEIDEKMQNLSNWTGIIKRKKKNGEIYSSENLLFPIVDSSNQATHLINVVNDISEKLKNEDKIRQAQKMDAIGALAGGIAHDFNNILTAIISNSEIALTTEEGEKTKYYINNILKSSFRAKDLTKQILTFSRMKEQDKSFVDIKSILKEAQAFLKQTIPANIQVEFNYPDDSPIVFADSTQILQVVLNLCTNAFYAVKEKGSFIHVKLETIEVDETLSKRFIKLKVGKYSRISVEDDGSGIPEEIKSKIFDPFFTTKKIGEGTGLGLSVAQGIISNIGGEIVFYTEFGIGTVFHIYLPYQSHELASTIEEKVTQNIISNEKILIVDDELMITETFAILLEDAGYKTIIFNDSMKALEYVKANPNDFDCAIVDQTMPKLLGTDFTKAIRDINPKVPIIICSGFSEKISGENLEKYKVQAYITKPVLKKDLLAAVSKAILNKIF